jgi:hypothetical protein
VRDHSRNLASGPGPSCAKARADMAAYAVLKGRSSTVIQAFGNRIRQITHAVNHAFGKSHIR